MADEELSGILKPGSFVGGRFKIDQVLGVGGMGTVYAAHHVTTGKEVALKLIRPSTTLPLHELARRFMREARTATAVQHPNIIEVFDVFIDSDGTPIMVMELLKGESFFDFRSRVGALRLHEVATILLPGLEALRVAHEKGIIHRDLKPENIFLAETPAGRVTKILDFGIAKVLDPGKLGSDTEGPRTQTNAMLGTPYYMSFEQAMSDRTIDHRADIWAMGVIIYEALTGRRPIEFETLGQMYTVLLKGTIPSIGAAVPDLPADALQVIDHALRKEREARLGDLGPLIDVLRRYSDPRVAGAMAGGTVIGQLPPPPAGLDPTNPPLSTSIARSTMGVPGRTIAIGATAMVGAAAVALALFVGLRPSASPAVRELPSTPPVTAVPSSVSSDLPAVLPDSGSLAFPPSTAAQTEPRATPTKPDAGHLRPRPTPNVNEASPHGIAPTLPY